MTPEETRDLIAEARECHQARGWSKDPLVNKLENLANRLANALESVRAERDAALARIADLEAGMERCERLKAAHMRSNHETGKYNEELLARIAEAAKLHQSEGWPLYGGGESKEYCTRCNCRWPCPTIQALDGAPEPEDVWEYALQAEGDDEPWSDCYETRELLSDNLDGLAAREDERLMRRRKAGPWEPVGGDDGE